MSTILDISWTFCAVEVFVKIASSRESAFFGWNPKIWWPSVEDDSEVLSWSTDTDFTIILSIKIVEDLYFGIWVKIGELLVWEEWLECFHDGFDHGSLIHVGHEHFGFVVSTYSVGHFDLLYADGDNDQ